MTSAIHRADRLLTPGRAPLRAGWLRVEDGRIAALGEGPVPANLAELPIVEHAGSVLMPGLVNAHAHLELTTLHDRLEPGTSFPAWAEQLRAFTASLGDADYRHAAREGVKRLLAGGCTTVLDVGNTGAALPVLAEGPLRAVACMETLGLDPKLAHARFEFATEVAARVPATERFRPGVTPHAAYSGSSMLIRRVLDAQRERGLPVTLHASESREEAELFASGTGPLADYCLRIYPGAPEHRGTTPVRWLESMGLLPERLVLVHGNTLDAGDMDLLARKGATVVHCPSSHAFFGHPRFPYAELRARGVNVALGTDSLASGDSLSMLEQMRLFAEKHPEVSQDEVLAMATTNSAKALGLGDEIGRLEAGYKADFIAVPLKDSAAGRIPAKVVIGGVEIGQ